MGRSEHIDIRESGAHRAGDRLIVLQSKKRVEPNQLLNSQLYFLQLGNSRAGGSVSHPSLRMINTVFRESSLAP